MNICIYLYTSIYFGFGREGEQSVSKLLVSGSSMHLSSVCIAGRITYQYFGHSFATQDATPKLH